MRQALAEFQRRTVNMQPTVTTTDAIHVAGVLHAIPSRTARMVRAGERTRDRKVVPQARPNSAGPSAAPPPYHMGDPTATTTPPNPRVQGAVTEGAGNQGAGEPGSPGRQIMGRVIDHDSAGASPPDSLERMAMGKIRKIKVRPKVSSHLNVNYRRRRPENPKPKDGKETKAVHPPAENSSPPEGERGGAE